MKGIDPALLTQIITAVVGLITGLGALLASLAAYYRSKSNSDKLDVTAEKLAENTALTQVAVDNHAGTMAKLETLGTKVVNVVPEQKE